MLDQWATTFGTYVAAWKVPTAERLPSDWVRLFDEAVDRQEALIVGGKWRSGPRSLLGVIQVRHLEKVHSAALAWLLDPNGWHGLEGRLLARFLGLAGLPHQRVDRHVRVTIEERCCHPSLERSGSADVVVRGTGWTLVVENKLWAGQHGDQLDLYYDAYGPSGAEFVYLTPDGVRPRSTRSDVVRAFTSVSWRRGVLPNLRDAIVEAEAVGPTPRAAREYLIALEEELL